MSKTLTEQWQNGEIDDGLYYFKLPSGETTITSKWGILGSAWKDTKDEIEVLAPVPSYEEFQSYEKCADMLIDVNKKWGKTIKEIKRLQEQKQKVIALIKDGRFVEALQELEK